MSNLNNRSYKDILGDYSSFEEYDEELSKSYLQNNNYNAEKMLWEQTKKENTSRGYRAYIDKFPEGKHTQKAESRLRSRLVIEEKDDWDEAKAKNTVESYENFKDKYPDSDKIDRANREIIDVLGWEKAEKSHTEDGYDEYISKHHNGKKLNKANEKIDGLKRETERKEKVLKTGGSFLISLILGVFLYATWGYVNNFILDHVIISFVILLSSILLMLVAINKTNIEWFFLLIIVLLLSTYTSALSQAIIVEYFYYIVILVGVGLVVGIYMFIDDYRSANSPAVTTNRNKFAITVFTISLFLMIVSIRDYMDKEKIETVQSFQKQSYDKQRSDLIALVGDIRVTDQRIEEKRELLGKKATKNNNTKSFVSNTDEIDKLKDKIENLEENRNKMIEQLEIYYSILKKEELKLQKLN